MPENVASSDPRWSRTRQRLIAGGRQVFATQGVEAATVQEIVRAAGVSQPSFYNHFSSKDELAREIAAEFFQRESRARQAVFRSVADPAEAIAINVAQTLELAQADPVIAWTLLRSGSLRELVISSQSDALAGMIASGIDQGRFAPGNPHTLALAIRGGALAVLQSLLAGQAGAGACAEFQELVLRMLGLAAREASTIVRRSRAIRGKVA